MEPEVERQKRLAAEAAAELVEDGMTVGLGTGSTVAYLLGPLAARNLDIRCVATSSATARDAVRVGLEVVDFSGPDAPAHLDIAIDGADQVAPSGWVVKGGGGAHTREKLVTAAASRFVVIVSPRSAPATPSTIVIVRSAHRRVGPARWRAGRCSMPRRSRSSRN